MDLCHAVSQIEVDIPMKAVELLVHHYSQDGVNLTFDDIKEIFSPADA